MDENELRDAGYLPYRKAQVAWLRRMRPGESLKGVSVNDTNLKEALGSEPGYIAVNPEDPDDKWYVSLDFFMKNYIPAKTNRT